MFKRLYRDCMIETAELAERMSRVQTSTHRSLLSAI